MVGTHGVEPLTAAWSTPRLYRLACKSTKIPLSINLTLTFSSLKFSRLNIFRWVGVRPVSTMNTDESLSSTLCDLFKIQIPDPSLAAAISKIERRVAGV